MNKTVLVALDYSKTDERLIQKAVEWTRGEEISIVLLHVFSFFDHLPDREVSQQDIENYSGVLSGTLLEGWESWERLEKASLSKLLEYSKQLEEAGVSVTTKHILGDPASVICSVARELEVDTIIVGRGGRRGIAEAVLGSVSNYVFHHAPCSVWAIYSR
ncbi:MAG: universal stress protein [Acaryochloridaceae cyanobacterium RU_4_10]|nr:universal stress protein [Acaryochloridaceae cyanobacterium RU_4_10]